MKHLFGIVKMKVIPRSSWKEKKKKKAVKGEEKILLLYRSEDTWRKEKAYKKKPVSFEATSTKHRWHRTTSLIFQET